MRGIPASQHADAQIALQALRDGAVECGQRRVVAGHHRADHRAYLQLAFPDGVARSQVVATVHYVQPIRSENELHRFVFPDEQRVDAFAVTVGRVGELPVVLDEAAISRGGRGTRRGRGVDGWRRGRTCRFGCLHTGGDSERQQEQVVFHVVPPLNGWVFEVAL